MGNFLTRFLGLTPDHTVLYGRFFHSVDVGQRTYNTGGTFQTTYYYDMTQKRCIRVDVAHGFSRGIEPEIKHPFTTTVTECDDNRVLVKVLLFEPFLTREEALLMVREKNV